MNIETSINPSLRDAHGQYLLEDRRVELNNKIKTAGPENLSIVCTLAHEYRHAWQDHVGLLRYVPFAGLGYSLIAERAKEADARAFGYTVMREVALAEKMQMIRYGRGKNMGDYTNTRLSYAWEKVAYRDPGADLSGAAQNAMFMAYMLSPAFASANYDTPALQYAAMHDVFMSHAALNPEQRADLSDNAVSLKKHLLGYASMPFLNAAGMMVERPEYVRGLDWDRLADDKAMHRLTFGSRVRWVAEQWREIDHFRPQLGKA